MLPLATLVLLAIALESIVGFGATVLVVALGTWILPVQLLLPVYVPVNMVLSASIAWRDRASIDVELLKRRVLPLAAAGLAVGFALYRYAARPELLHAFGVMVVLIGLNELRKVLWPPATPSVSRARSNALLVGGAWCTGCSAPGACSSWRRSRASGWRRPGCAPRWRRSGC